MSLCSINSWQEARIYNREKTVSSSGTGKTIQQHVKEWNQYIFEHDTPNKPQMD